MKYRTAIVFTAVAALCAAAPVACVPSPEKPPPPAEAAETPKACSTCTLRHQRLGQSKEARERERAKLRELYENSKPNSQQP